MGLCGDQVVRTYEQEPPPAKEGEINNNNNKSLEDKGGRVYYFLNQCNLKYT